MASRLASAAVGIWFGGVGLYLALVERLQYKFRNSDFVKESFRMTNEYPHLDKLLGLPVKRTRFDLGDDFIKKDDDYAQMVIPLIGRKNKGKVYSWCSRQMSEDNQEHWRVDRLDLMVHGHDPFTFYKCPDASYVNDKKLTEAELVR